MTRLLTISAAAIGLLAAPALAANLQSDHPHHAMKDVIVHAPSHPHAKHVASTHVRYDDVDAASPDGAKVVLERIRTAAKKVCSPKPHGKRSLQENSDYKDCLREATEDGVKGVNTPAVNAAYKGA
jgi:UrcA family protein